MQIIRINRFSERIYEAVLKLLPQLSPNAKIPDRKYFKRLLSSKNVHFFIAEAENKKIAGMLTIATYDIPTGMKVWIEDVVVDAIMRGQGVGKELIRFAIEYSGSIGASNVNLTSRPSRIEANRLYQELGFVKYETNVYKYLL